MKLQEIGESNTIPSYIHCTLHLITVNLNSRLLGWAGHVAHVEESRNAYRVLVGRLEGKGSSGWSRRSWEDNIKMYLKEVGSDASNWMDFTQERDQWWACIRAEMNLSGFLESQLVISIFMVKNRPYIKLEQLT